MLSITLFGASFLGDDFIGDIILGIFSVSTSISCKRVETSLDVSDFSGMSERPRLASACPVF